MKIKQISLRAFEIDPAGESDEAIYAYVMEQAAIVRRFLLLFCVPISSALFERLKGEGFSVAIRQGELVQKSTARPATMEATGTARQPETLVYHKPVRSGERIEHGGDLIAFGRINSGAELFIDGSCTLFDQLDGMLSCEGPVAVLHGVGRSAVVVFGGELIDSGALKGKAPLKLHKVAGKITIESFETSIKR